MDRPVARLGRGRLDVWVFPSECAFDGPAYAGKPRGQVRGGNARSQPSGAMVYVATMSACRRFLGGAASRSVWCVSGRVAVVVRTSFGRTVVIIIRKKCCLGGLI